jgi:hypothetical protein
MGDYTFVFLKILKEPMLVKQTNSTSYESPIEYPASWSRSDKGVASSTFHTKVFKHEGDKSINPYAKQE